jgi:hypothetical protein
MLGAAVIPPEKVRRHPPIGESGQRPKQHGKAEGGCGTVLTIQIVFRHIDTSFAMEIGRLPLVQCLSMAMSTTVPVSPHKISTNGRANTAFI